MDGLSRSVRVEPAWFVVECGERWHHERVEVPGEEKRFGILRQRRVVDGPGCGYVGKAGRVSAKPVYLTKAEAKRIAAAHRKMHRAQRKEGVS